MNNDLYLQDYYHHCRVAQLRCSDNLLKKRLVCRGVGWISRILSSVFINRKNIVISGYYATVGSENIGVFVLDGNLFLRTQRQILMCSAETTCGVERAGTHRMTVIRDGQSVYAIEYNPPQAKKFDDETPFVDEEEIDFVLWIANLINSPARRRDFIKSFQSSS